MSKRLHLDLFSGIGGFALAAGWAGFETAMFCEIDPFARKVLAKHWPEVPIHDDIHTLTADIVGQPIDLITGGFPCQPFSVAGKRRGQEDDRHLWPQMARIIGECRPRWVLGENTPGIIGLALDDCLADLESLGYEAWPVVVPACGVGAWHRRERVWIVAHAEREQSKQQSGVSECGRRWVGGGGQTGIRGIAADAADGGLRRGDAPGQAGQPAQLREVATDAERGGRREPLRTHATQGSLSPAIGEEGALGTRSGGSDAPHATCELPHWLGSTRGWRAESSDGDWWEFESRLRGMVDGLPGWMDGGVTDPPPGLASGIPNRAARLKSLGNAIVPSVAFEILKSMKGMDDAIPNSY